MIKALQYSGLFLFDVGVAAFLAAALHPVFGLLSFVILAAIQMITIIANDK